METVEARAKVKEILGETEYNVLADAVAKIEDNRLPTTQNNYGRYMAILAKAPNKQSRVTMANVLVLLGANRQGVIDALRLC